MRRCDKPTTWRLAIRSISSAMTTSASCCVHGFTGTPFEVRYLGEQLARAGFTVHGAAAARARHVASPTSIATTWQDWAEAVERAVDALRRPLPPGRGRRPVARRPARAPPREPAPRRRRASPRSPRRSGSRACPRGSRGGRGPRGALARGSACVPKLGGSDVRDRAREGREPVLRRRSRRARSASCSRSCAIVDAALPRVTQPVLVLHATQDHTAPVACARADRRAHARGRASRILPRSYHLIAVDVERDIVAAEVDRVLRAATTPARPRRPAMRHVIAIDQGTTGSTVLVLDEQLAASAAAATRSSARSTRSRAGSSTIPRTSGRSVTDALRPGARRASSRRRSRRSASPTSARPRCSGIARPASRAQRDRLAGPPHRRSLRRAQGRRQGGARPRAHRADARPVLLGHEGQLDARQRRPALAAARAQPASSRSAPIDSFLVWRLTGGAVHATDVTNASRTLLFDLQHARRGATSCSSCSACRARCCPRSSPSSGVDRHDARACPGCPTASRSRASPAISRPRCSARPASRPATRSARTAPARSS